MRDDDSWTLGEILVTIVAVAIIGCLLVIASAGFGHRRGVIDAAKGTWKAEQHESGEWIVWEVKP